MHVGASTVGHASQSLAGVTAALLSQFDVGFDASHRIVLGRNKQHHVASMYVTYHSTHASPFMVRVLSWCKCLPCVWMLSGYRKDAYQREGMGVQVLPAPAPTRTGRPVLSRQLRAMIQARYILHIYDTRCYRVLTL